MHRAAVWQHSRNSNNKIVHNSIEDFLCNSSDFFSDDNLSCLWVAFTNSVFQVPPQKIVRLVEIFWIGWPGIIGLTWNNSVPWGQKIYLRYSSVLFKVLVWNDVVPHFSNRTLEYHRHNFPWDRLISRKTDNPWSSYSQDLNLSDHFLRGDLRNRVCESNPQKREDIIRKEIRRIAQEMLKRVVNNFIVWVAAHTAAQRIGRT